MPIWAFYCPHCKTTTEELFTSYEASRFASCKTCGRSDLERVPTSGTFILKGAGFYKNDYRSK